MNLIERWCWLRHITKTFAFSPTDCVYFFLEIRFFIWFTTLGTFFKKTICNWNVWEKKQLEKWKTLKNRFQEMENVVKIDFKYQNHDKKNKIDIYEFEYTFINIISHILKSIRQFNTLLRKTTFPYKWNDISNIFASAKCSTIHFHYVLNNWKWTIEHAETEGIETYVEQYTKRLKCCNWLLLRFIRSCWECLIKKIKLNEKEHRRFTRFQKKKGSS